MEKKGKERIEGMGGECSGMGGREEGRKEEGGMLGT